MKITELSPSLVWKYFNEITQVPRPSKKEEKIRAYLVETAKKLGLDCKTDAIGNVLISKPASKGCENAPTVILQGHMDMVCEKNGNVKHDFDNDPIETIIEGEWVRANGTTLGADNGIGVSASLAVLADDSLVHGPIQALFTVDEETGLTGANNIKEGFIDGKYLLNLDTEEEAEITIGCAGGIDTTVTFTYTPEPAPKDYFYFDLNISNFHGGHSGTDINVGRASANKILARFLWETNKKYGLQLAAISGGNLRNAIAREAKATFGVPAQYKEQVRVDANAYLATITAEYAGVEDGETIDLSSAEVPATVIDKKTADNLISALFSAPHGVIGMSNDIEGLVETSTNLAAVKMLEGNKILVTTSQRSSVESKKFAAASMLEAHFTMAGGVCTHGDGYPGWKPNMNSKLLKIAVKAYEDLYQVTPVVNAIHAGLECGLFLTKYPNLEMISFGPTLRDVHSPKERMHIPAVEKFWNHIVKILAEVAKETK